MLLLRAHSPIEMSHLSLTLDKWQRYSHAEFITFYFISHARVRMMQIGHLGRSGYQPGSKLHSRRLLG